MARNPFSLSVIRTASLKLPSKPGLRTFNTTEERNTDLIMTDGSMLVSDTGRSLLGDSSVLDSKIIETSKENIFIGLASDVEEEMPQIETRVVLIQEAGKREELLKALEEIKVPYIKMESVEEFGDSESPEFETVFIVADFQDSILENLYKFDCRVLGPPIVLHCAQKGEPLPFSCRPLYCASMLNLVLCFTGFRKKEELVKLVTLVHHMGGIIRRDFSSKVTHLVANSTQGDKFRLAVSLGTPIVKAEWIYKAWERRNEIDFRAADEEFRNEFKVPPFQDCMLSFLGFSDEERINMEEMTKMQGGQYLPVSDDRCTHLVVEENTVKDLPFEPPKKLYVVKQEWFWGSIQMDARAGESMYLFEKPESPELKKSVSQLSLNTPNSNRKRRRLRETLAQLTRETDMSPFPPRKRQSAEHSLSMGSLLDISNTPESIITNGETPKSCSKPSKNSTPLPAKQSARWQVAKELYQTESNYVDILTTIIQLFQVPLEKEGQLGGPILAQEEIKTIFGSIPDILDVHTKIKEDLEGLMINWAESKSIGDVILRYSKDLLKTYPPFVNFFEMSKETIMKCEKQKPRFHAFLKINQAKQECGRQSLAELLIRPVQRLPSVALLLNDLKKHTAEDNPDKGMLERAIESLKEVMTHINEDKRKTEAQRLIFDVVYEVDGCPANLLSSHRSLVQRLETVALGDDLCDRGEQVTLFLFNDCLEIARKRHKVISAFKSPHGQTRPPASLKHIVLMPLSQIKKVLDIKETEDCHKAFALVVRPPTEQNNLLFSFQMTTEEPPKEDWLKMLCRHVANTICKADAENLIYTTDPDSIDINTKDVDSTLSRASRAIKKTSKKVTRAFSFSKTPKRALRRALMAHNTVEGRSPCSASESYLGSRLTSTSSLAIARSSSTYSLNGSVKHVVSVQRSNSVDGSSQSSRSRPVLRPDSPTSRPSHAREGKTPSSPESLNGHSLARPCPIPVITTTCDVGDDRSGVENSSVVKP
ncbi:protein ECT2 isoform X2 [Dermochelys coriacea]|uniref:protein ECT2 isoform X2 n=1 Tax=Dermochelys coriacea TaxID=27794 RepID=UPI0018E83020|nr:protein ECT2 isoform X2 [Dermochelys coriacea]XP_043347503.1 protein ECT2 isoform X2 [Dermochelys coriacea]